MEDLIGKTLKLKEDLTLVSIDDTAALLDVERRRYFDPNDTASFLMKLMESGCPYEDLIAELVSEFDAAEETVRGDVDNLVEELLRLGLVDSGEDIAHEIALKPQKERKPYQAPQLQSLPVLVAEGTPAPSPK